eukprot:COSAG05_NODE_8470_length_700_cov_8.103161_1_plen_90_part_00
MFIMDSKYGYSNSLVNSAVLLTEKRQHLVHRCRQLGKRARAGLCAGKGKSPRRVVRVPLPTGGSKVAIMRGWVLPWRWVFILLAMIGRS